MVFGDVVAIVTCQWLQQKQQEQAMLDAKERALKMQADLIQPAMDAQVDAQENSQEE